jgi:2-phosphosulfolactate phosphatase
VPAQVVAGCLRNAAAVARRVAGLRRVGLVPAGERWSDSSIRFAYEDLVGAGAIVVRLRSLVPDIVTSPETDAAALAFEHCRPLADTASGKELIVRGFGADVRLAGEVDASDIVPVLSNGCFEA